MLQCLILRFAMPNPSPLIPIHDCANGYFLGERKVCVWKTDFATRVEIERREIHIHRHHHCRFSQEPHMWPTRCCITQETRLRPQHSFLASKKTTYIIYVWLNCLAGCCLQQQFTKPNPSPIDCIHNCANELKRDYFWNTKSLFWKNRLCYTWTEKEKLFDMNLNIPKI